MGTFFLYTIIPNLEMGHKPELGILAFIYQKEQKSFIFYKVDA